MKLRALPLLLAATLTLAAACSDDDDGSAEVDSILDDSGNAGAGDDEATDEETSTTTEDDATTAGGEALGSARSQLPADPNDERLVPLRIDVVSLTRNEDLLDLELVLVNEAEAEAGADADADADALIFEPWSHFVDDPATVRTDLSGVGLVDQAEQKLYLPVLDSDDQCLCSGNLANVAVMPGESVRLTATYGGVPDDVDTLDVHIPQFPIIAGIEVSR